MTRGSAALTLSRPQTLLVAALALALLALSSWGLYTFLTSRSEIAVWDMHTGWLGLRAMLRDGIDPYSDQIALASEDQIPFSYPLYIVVLLGPLALLPLPAAQAIWLSLLILSLFVFIIFAPRAVGWHPRPWLLALTAFFVLGLYHNVWALILGQVSIVAATCIALAWWGVRTERWVLAGACLALATLKPQMCLLVVPGMLAWAIYRNRWRLVAAFFLWLGVLLLLPCLWLPTWPLSWLAAVGRHVDSIEFHPPLVALTGLTWLAYAIAGLLLAWAVWYWWRTPQRDKAPLHWAFSMLVVVNVLIIPHNSYVNQLVLLLPLFYLFARLPGDWYAAAVEIGLLAGLWLMAALLSPAASSPAYTEWQHRLIGPILPVGLALALIYFRPRQARGGA